MFLATRLIINSLLVKIGEIMSRIAISIWILFFHRLVIQAALAIRGFDYSHT